MTIKTPVRMNDKYEIVDKNGNIIFPDVTFFKYNTSGLVNRDIIHISKQKEIAMHVIELINGAENAKEIEAMPYTREPEQARTGRWAKFAGKR